MARKGVRDPGDHGLCSFVLLFPCCFPAFVWKAKVPPAHFAVALCFWIAIISMATAFTYRFWFHSSATWRAFPGEVRILEEPRFTEHLFCSGVHLEGTYGAKLFAYTTSEPPKLNPKRSRFRILRKFRLSANDLMTFSANLIPRSVLGAGICTEEDAAMYLVQGNANLQCVEDSVKKTGEVEQSCVLSTTEFTLGSNFTSCVFYPWPGAWAKAETDNLPEQFHVVYQAIGDEANIQAVIILNRSNYEDPEDKNLAFCNGTTSCFLPFHSRSWNGARNVVVFRVGWENRSQIKVTASCVANIGAYLVLFGGGFAVVFVAIVFVTWFLHRKEKKLRAARRKKGTRNFYQNTDPPDTINEEELSVSSEMQPITRI